MNKRAEIEKPYLEKGMVIEAGWQSFKTMSLSGAPEDQIMAMRTAFFAGADNAVSSVLLAVDQPPGTMADVLVNLGKEMVDWRESVKARADVLRQAEEAKAKGAVQ